MKKTALAVVLFSSLFRRMGEADDLDTVGARHRGDR